MVGVFLLMLVPALTLYGHAPPVPVPKPPYRLQGTRLLDAEDKPFVLSGVTMSGLSRTDPGAGAELNSLTFRVIRQRWNMVAVRISVSPALWRSDGRRYLDRIAQTARLANAEGLVAVIAVTDEAGFPDASTVEFWTACAAALKDNPMVMFSVYARPSAGAVPGYVQGTRRAADWEFWRNGGTASNGRVAAGMQGLVDAVRSTGAQQLVSVAAFFDPLDFRGFEPAHAIQGQGVIYEVCPYFDHALTDGERDANFGFLASQFHVYAAEWGTPFHEDSAACRAVPADPGRAIEAVSQLLIYFTIKGMSWTAAAFEPHQLIDGYAEYDPSLLDGPWRCGEPSGAGMGGVLLLWLTGDLLGFGSIAADQIANAAGGPAGPVVPGQILAIYGQQIGPEDEVRGELDPQGLLARRASDVEVFFDGMAAPVVSAGYFVVKTQVPYEVRDSESVELRMTYRSVPSNRIRVPVAAAAPQLFTVPGSITDAVAVNGEGSQNSTADAARAGTALTFLATGCGQTSPAGVTGLAASAPAPVPVAPLSLTIGGQEAELVAANEAVGMVGVIRIDARVPALTAGSGPRRAPVVLTAAGAKSRSDVTIWIQ